MKRKHSMIFTLMVTQVLVLSTACEEEMGFNEEDFGSELGEIGQSKSELYVKTSSVWSSGDIKVCWENAAGDNQTERNWVRQAVTRTWETAAAIDFVGWGDCGSSEDIRILIDDDGPHCKGLGKQLDGVRNGIVLNFDFQNWGCGGPCTFPRPNGKTRQDWIELIAVHEFGHALGFSHEHNRPDTPKEKCLDYACKKNSDCGDSEICVNGICRQGANGDETVGAWDLDSVMNYCNPRWSNDGVLSATDIRGARRYYPGNVHAHKLDSDGTNGKYLYSEEWTNGYTSVEFYNVSGNDYMFLMKADEGVVRIHKVNGDGTKGSFVKQYDGWSRGWDTAEFYSINGSTYLFLLKSSNGAVHIQKMNSDGTVGERVETDDWSNGWTNAEFYTIDGKTYLFLLKSSNGVVHIQRMNSDGTVGSRVQTSDWSNGWDTAEFFKKGGKTYLLLLKSSNGQVHIQEMNSNGTVGKRTMKEDWSNGWTNAAFYQWGSKTYMIILKTGTGDVHFHEINSGGTVGKRTTDTKWRAGWTIVETYVTNDSPRLFLLMENK